MKKIIYFLFILQFALSYAQNEKLKATKLDSIEVKADSFVGFDGFNNCIYIKNNVLYKKIDQSNAESPPPEITTFFPLYFSGSFTK